MVQLFSMQFAVRSGSFVLLHWQFISSKLHPTSGTVKVRQLNWKFFEFPYLLKGAKIGLTYSAWWYIGDRVLRLRIVGGDRNDSGPDGKGLDQTEQWHFRSHQFIPRQIAFSSRKRCGSCSCRTLSLIILQVMAMNG